MITTDLTISLANWALNIEQQRASVGAQNIAAINTTGIKQIGDFERLITQMADAVEGGSATDVAKLLNTRATVSEHGDMSGSAVALDEEVLGLSQAKGRFKVIAEALAKKYGLMNIAVGSK